jgi:hypothetical protein
VAVSMSWLDACAYAEFERANGMRFPPTIAARRGVAERVVAIADLRGSGRIARYRQYQVPSVT